MSHIEDPAFSGNQEIARSKEVKALQEWMKDGSQSRKWGGRKLVLITDDQGEHIDYVQSKDLKGKNVQRNLQKIIDRCAEEGFVLLGLPEAFQSYSELRVKRNKPADAEKQITNPLPLVKIYKKETDLLFQAAEKGDVKALKATSKINPFFLKEKKNGKTVLQVCLANGHVEFAKELVQKFGIKTFSIDDIYAIGEAQEKLRDQLITTKTFSMSDGSNIGKAQEKLRDELFAIMDTQNISNIFSEAVHKHDGKALLVLQGVDIADSNGKNPFQVALSLGLLETIQKMVSVYVGEITAQDIDAAFQAPSHVRKAIVEVLIHHTAHREVDFFNRMLNDQSSNLQRILKLQQEKIVDDKGDTIFARLMQGSLQDEDRQTAFALIEHCTREQLHHREVKGATAFELACLNSNDERMRDIAKEFLKRGKIDHQQDIMPMLRALITKLEKLEKGTSLYGKKLKAYEEIFQVCLGKIERQDIVSIMQCSLPDELVRAVVEQIKKEKTDFGQTCQRLLQKGCSSLDALRAAYVTGFVLQGVQTDIKQLKDVLAKITVSPKGMQHIFDELGTSEKITQLKISYEQILKIREKQPAFTASDAFVTAYLHDIEVPKVHELFQKQIQEQGHYYHTEGDLPQGWRVRLQDTEFSVVTAHQLGKGTYNTCEIAVRFMKQKPPEYEVHRSSELRKEKYPAEKHDFQEEITIASIVSGKEQIVTMPFATLLTNGKDEFQMCMSLEPCGVRWGDTTSVDLDGILEKRDHVLQNPQTRRKELLQRLRVFRDYTKGVATLHQMGIVHFDLKPGNCLLKEDETGNIRGYVADFGTAMRRGPDGKFHKLNSILSEGHQTYSTPEYASPTLLYARGATGQLLTKEEMLEKINHDEIVPEKEDIWALGITLKELFDHQDFSWMTSIKEAVLEKSRIGHIRSKEEVSDHLEALPSKIKEVEAQIKKLLVQSMRKEGELRQKLQQKEALEDEMDIYILLNFMLQNDPQMRLSADALVPKIDEVIERMEERLNQEEPQELRKDESKQEI